MSKIDETRRIVVTGLGAVTAAGLGVTALWEAAKRGNSLARWREADECGDARTPACVVPELPLEQLAHPRLARMDRTVQLASIASKEAWEDAHLHTQPPTPERVAIFVGSSRGPLGTNLKSEAAFLAGSRVRPSVAPNATFACLSGSLSLLFQARGPCLTVAGACASGAMALGLAAQQILTGMVDLALAGGTEAPLHDWLIAQLRSARVLAEHDDPRQACRPFDAARNGAVLGEGAAFVVLESLASAKKRGVPILAGLAGWAIASEGDERIGTSDGRGSLRCMREALEKAGLPPSEIGYINAHGTGTLLNDRTEAQAIDLLGGKTRIPTSSTKAVTGHCMGATAAVEAVISIRALQEQVLPPSANCAVPAEDCPVDLVLGAPRPASVRAVMSNSAGFWGSNAALVFTPA